MPRAHGPWTILETIEKYKNPWIRVTEDQVLRPDGSPGIYGVVNVKPGISVLPIDADGYIYLTKEFHYAFGEVTIETVSGGIDAHEQPIDAARRELEEELGIVAKTWTDMGPLYPVTSIIHLPMQLFIAEDISFVSTRPEITELISVIKVSLAEAMQMVMNGDITHSVSCVLVLKAAHHFKLQ